MAEVLGGPLVYFFIGPGFGEQFAIHNSIGQSHQS
jgi:hypothetical protein